MYNNASYRQYSVSGTTSFSFSPVGNTVRMLAAIWAWTGATVNRSGAGSGKRWLLVYRLQSNQPIVLESGTMSMLSIT